VYGQAALGSAGGILITQMKPLGCTVAQMCELLGFRAG
jgi:hypothetical protein